MCVCLCVWARAIRYKVRVNIRANWEQKFTYISCLLGVYHKYVLFMQFVRDHTLGERTKEDRSLNRSKNVCGEHIITRLHDHTRCAWDIPIRWLARTRTHTNVFSLARNLFKYKSTADSGKNIFYSFAWEPVWWAVMLIYTYENRTSFFIPRKKKPLYAFFVLYWQYIYWQIIYTICIYKMEIIIWMWAIFACTAHVCSMHRRIERSSERMKENRGEKRGDDRDDDGIQMHQNTYGFDPFFKKNEKTETVQPPTIEKEKKQEEKRTKLNILVYYTFFSSIAATAAERWCWCCVCVFI